MDVCTCQKLLRTSAPVCIAALGITSRKMDEGFFVNIQMHPLLACCLSWCCQSFCCAQAQGRQPSNLQSPSPSPLNQEHDPSSKAQSPSKKPMRAHEERLQKHQVRHPSQNHLTRELYCLSARLCVSIVGCQKAYLHAELMCRLTRPSRWCDLQAHDIDYVRSVKSDERASRLWPDPQEPEYYL